MCVYDCLSVPPFFDTTVGPRPNMSHIMDRSGNGSKLNKFALGDFFGGQKLKSGICHELPRKSIYFFNPHRVVDSFGAKKSRNFHKVQRKSIHLF